MGKCGGHELNYVSDVDVIFVAEAADGHDEQAAIRAATMLAANLMRVCSDHTAEGTIWPVDAALRPEGKSGPLVRTLASHESYYQRWAKTWEFQALLKARPVAGDAELGREYVERIAPMVWSASDARRLRDRGAGDAPPGARPHPGGAGRPADQARRRRAARRRVRGAAAADGARPRRRGGPGADDAVARWPTSPARGYVGRDDGAALDEAYRFLRTLEHRMQLAQLRRMHVVPEDQASLRRLGRSMGLTKEPVEELNKQWRRHSREVRRLHEKLFYRPLLAAVAKLPDRRGAALAGVREAAAVRAGLRRPGGRAAPPRGADRRG